MLRHWYVNLAASYMLGSVGIELVFVFITEFATWIESCSILTTLFAEAIYT